jgi:hypothetical protein
MMRTVVSSSGLVILICLLGCSPKPRTDTINAGFFQKIQYDPVPHILTIYFTDGSAYAYKTVPERVYNQLLRSDDPGLFFNDEIRDRYTFELIHVRTAHSALPQLVIKEVPSEPEFVCSEPSSANRKALKSELLDFAAYDAKDKCMILYFDRRGVYEYGGVPPQVFSGLIQTRNVGGFFNKHIWGKYPKRRIRR